MKNALFLASLSLLISSCATTGPQGDRTPSSDYLVNQIRKNLSRQSRNTLPGDQLHKDVVNIPLDPSLYLGHRDLGQGYSAETEEGMECVQGETVTRRHSPRVEYFVRHDRSAQYGEELVYVVGARIISAKTELVNAHMNPQWLQVAQHAEGGIEGVCGTHYLGAYEHGILVSQEIPVEQYDENYASIERFSDYAQFKDRLARIQRLSTSGNIFNIGFIDSQDSVIQEYKNQIQGFGSIESFVDYFVKHRTDKTQNSLYRSNSIVGVEIRQNPKK